MAFVAAGLSGCAAAAIPLTVAQVGIGGFEAFKLMEIGTGGSVGVAFPRQNGKTVPPPPLPLVRRVAVWPGNEDEVFLTERLAATKRFSVETPNRVRAILADAKITTNFNGLTAGEQYNALRLVCRRTRAGLVLAAQNAGTLTRSNALSFQRPEKVTNWELLGFSCARRRVVWRDAMRLIVKLGDHTPSTTAIMKVAGDAWADRVIAAEADSTSEIGALNQ
ncbi:MAG: hypothetical protein ACREE3_03510 [Stellaceae bacterium]